MTNKKTTHIDKIIGYRIRIARQNKGFTMEYIAIKIGVRTNQVYKYEKGMNRLAANKIPLLSKLLDVSISYFFDECYDQQEFDFR